MGKGLAARMRAADGHGQEQGEEPGLDLRLDLRPDLSVLPPPLSSALSA